MRYPFAQVSLIFLPLFIAYIGLHHGISLATGVRLSRKFYGRTLLIIASSNEKSTSLPIQATDKSFTRSKAKYKSDFNPSDNDRTGKSRYGSNTLRRRKPRREGGGADGKPGDSRGGCDGFGIQGNEEEHANWTDSSDQADDYDNSLIRNSSMRNTYGGGGSTGSLVASSGLNPVLQSAMSAIKSVSVASFSLIKGSIKASADALAVKYVHHKDILGTWRFEQTVIEEDGTEVVEAASIEVLRNNTVRTRCGGITRLSPYVFVQRPWPRRCSIAFEACTHHSPGQSEPETVMYKGYFKRSLMNPDVVFIRGSVFQTRGRLFWKTQEKCGSFKATKRRTHSRL